MNKKQELYLKNSLKELQKNARKFLRKKEILENKIWNLESEFDKYVLEKFKNIEKELNAKELDLYGNLTDDDLAYFDNTEWNFHWDKKTLYSTIKVWMKDLEEEKQWKKTF